MQFLLLIHIYFFIKDAFKRPDMKSGSDKERVKLFLRVVRPRLIRAKIYFVGIKYEAPLAKLTILAKKFGKKTRHRLIIMELNDGTLAVKDYEPAE